MFSTTIGRGSAKPDHTKPRADTTAASIKKQLQAKIKSERWRDNIDIKRKLERHINHEKVWTYLDIDSNNKSFLKGKEDIY